MNLDELDKLETDEGAWLYYHSKKPGEHLENLAPEILKTAVSKLHFPKTMRWGAHSTEFIRPVQWIVLLYGDELISTKILGLQTQNLTYGHRFHHPEAITLNNASSYVSTLEKAGKVIVDFYKAP